MSDVQTMYQSLLIDIADSGVAMGVNYVAYSGGVDSALVACAVHEIFPENSLAVMALSPSVSLSMRQTAEQVATHIGIPLRFVRTNETNNPEYVANQGMSCYICKTGIYQAMRAVEENVAGVDIRLFNGTNAEDLADPTRVGLIAAREHAVLSPLSRFTKAEIRQMSKLANLPNWNAAPSPCLRSRLHVGVPATEEHLRRIEAAEEAIRRTFRLRVEHNLRVRHLMDDTAMIEVDEILLSSIDLGQCRPALMALGFSDVRKRAFQTGGVAGQNCDSEDSTTSVAWTNPKP